MLRKRALRFNWRLALAHIIVNALSLALVFLLLPGLSITQENRVFILLVSGFLFGVLNAIVRPVLQFVMFNFLFATYGLVLVLINFILLILLEWITPNWFSNASWWWALLAAVLIGLFGVVLESLFGMSAPIIDTDEPQTLEDIEDVVMQRMAMLIDNEIELTPGFNEVVPETQTNSNP